MPSPTGHHRRGPTSYAHPAHPTGSTGTRPGPAHIRAVTDRTDLTVVVAPGAGGGAPACFYPARHASKSTPPTSAHPTIANPHRAGHKRIVPHRLRAARPRSRPRRPQPLDRTRPTPRRSSPTSPKLLEESRIEGRHRTRRPRDRQWLRAHRHHPRPPRRRTRRRPVARRPRSPRCCSPASTPASSPPKTSAASATRSPPSSAARLLDQLRDIWRQALQVADDDAATMIDLARQWCHILGIDPDPQPDIPTPDPGAVHRPARRRHRRAGPPRRPGSPCPTTSPPPPTAPRTSPAPPTPAASGDPASWTRRDPTRGRTAAARDLAAPARRRPHHPPEPGRAPAALPPGRLRTRARHHRARPDRRRADTHRHTVDPPRTRNHPTNPTLHLAVLVDVSGSMRDYAAPMSSAAWILAHAAHRNHAITTTIALRRHTPPCCTRPGQRPAQVLDMDAAGGTDTFIPAHQTRRPTPRPAPPRHPAAARRRLRRRPRRPRTRPETHHHPAPRRRHRALATPRRHAMLTPSPTPPPSPSPTRPSAITRDRRRDDHRPRQRLTRHSAAHLAAAPSAAACGRQPGTPEGASDEPDTTSFSPASNSTSTSTAGPSPP